MMLSKLNARTIQRTALVFHAHENRQMTTIKMKKRQPFPLCRNVL